MSQLVLPFSNIDGMSAAPQEGETKDKPKDQQQQGETKTKQKDHHPATFPRPNDPPKLQNASFYEDLFSCPSDKTYPKYAESIRKSVDAMNAARIRNQYDHWTPPGPPDERPHCNHEYCQDYEIGWTSGRWKDRRHWTCSACSAVLDNKKQHETFLAEAVIKKDLYDETNAALEDKTFDQLLHERAVPVSWLLYFTFKHDCWEWPTWRIKRDIILPATSSTPTTTTTTTTITTSSTVHNNNNPDDSDTSIESGERCRYADLPEMKCIVGPARVFLSHCWASKWGDLVAAACHGARKDRRVWIDLFAVRQWSGNSKDIDFEGVMKRCNAVVVSVSKIPECDWSAMAKIERYGGEKRDSTPTPDEHKNKKSQLRRRLFIFRLWCIVEMMAAKKHNVPLVVKCGVAIVDGDHRYRYDMHGAAEMLSHLACCVSIEDCDSANPKDKVDQLIRVRKMGIPKLSKMIETIVACGANSIHQQVAHMTDAAVCGEWELLEKQRLGPGPTRGGVGGRTDEEAMTLRILIASCVGGFTLIVKWLIGRYKPTVRKFVDEAGCLQLAAKYGHATIVSLLLNSVDAALNGSTPMNSPDPGTTALFLATRSGRTEAVRVLLNSNGIDVTKHNQGNRSFPPFCVACEYGSVEIVKMYLKHKLSESEITLGFLFACQTGQVLVVKELLSTTSVDVNKVSRGNNPLDIACQNNHIGVVRLLLKSSNINPNQVHQQHGITSLVRATYKNHPEIVRELLLHPEIEVSKGAVKCNASPLLHACYYGFLDIATMFIEHPDTEINAESGTLDPSNYKGCRKKSYTAREMAVTKGHDEIVKCIDHFETKTFDLSGLPTQLHVLVDYLTEDEMHLLNGRFEEIQSSFVEHAIGGRVKGRPRSFLVWIARHVIQGSQGSKAGKDKVMRSGGVSVLKLLLAAAVDCSWIDFNTWRAKRTWTSIRMETAKKEM